MKVCGSCKYYQSNATIPARAAHESGVCRLNPPPNPNVDPDSDWCSRHEAEVLPEEPS